MEEAINPAMGTIVSWKAPKEVLLEALENALDDAGFDPKKLCRPMIARDAFTRAARELSESRVIDKISEDETTISFQFTKKWIEEQEFKFDKEFVLTVHKETGTVTGGNPELAKTAFDLLVQHQGKRNTSDVSRMIQKIFEAEGGDLIPLREAGGVYFVPDSHKELVDAIRKLLKDIGGYLCSFDIRFGQEDTQDSVAEAMTNHLSDLISQFRESCQEINPESADWLVDRRKRTIKSIKDKLECYHGLLQGHSERLGHEVNDAETLLLEHIKKETEA